MKYVILFLAAFACVFATGCKKEKTPTPKPPMIESFYVNDITYDGVAYDSVATLVWKVSGDVEHTSINGIPFDFVRTVKTKMLYHDSTFTLTATGPAGSATETRTCHVTITPMVAKLNGWWQMTHAEVEELNTGIIRQSIVPSCTLGMKQYMGLARRVLSDDPPGCAPPPPAGQQYWYTDTGWMFINNGAKLKWGQTWDIELLTSTTLRVSLRTTYLFTDIPIIMRHTYMKQ